MGFEEPQLSPYRLFRAGCECRLEKSEHALTGLLRPFLLYPMTSPVDDVRYSHVSAGFRLHRFESTRLAVDAPVGLTRDEASRNVDGTAGEEL